MPALNQLTFTVETADEDLNDLFMISCLNSDQGLMTVNQGSPPKKKGRIPRFLKTFVYFSHVIVSQNRGTPI